MTANAITRGPIGRPSRTRTSTRPTENGVVRARINEQIKNDAAVVLAAMGLTVSDAFRMLLTRIAREHALPFEPLVPNKKTIAAMQAARRGELTTVSGIDELLESLNEKD